MIEDGAKVTNFEKQIGESGCSSKIVKTVTTALSGNLLKLTLKGSTCGFRLSDNDVIGLTESLIKANIQLIDLSLTYHHITDVGLEEIARLLQPGVFDQVSNNLQGLDLEGNSITGTGFAATNLSSTFDCPLSYLNITCNPLNNAGRLALADIVSKNKTLRQLSISSCGFEVTSIIAFLTNLHSNSTLELLYMDRPLLGSSTSVDDVACDHLSRVIMSPKSALLDLSLRYCDIHNNGAKLIAEAMMTNLSLVHVNLECNKIGDVGVEAIATYLLKRVNNSVKSIGLSNNVIGDDGAIALAEAIRSNVSLSNISLKNNKIGPLGLTALCDVLEVNNTLESLSLFGNRFDNGNGKQYHSLINSRIAYTGLFLDIDVYIVDGFYQIAEI